jgi:hypothetical protein
MAATILRVRNCTEREINLHFLFSFFIRLLTCSNHNLPLHRFLGLAGQLYRSTFELGACPGSKLDRYGLSWLGMETLGLSFLLVLPAHRNDRLRARRREHVIFSDDYTAHCILDQNKTECLGRVVSHSCSAQSLQR